MSNYSSTNSQLFNIANRALQGVENTRGAVYSLGARPVSVGAVKSKYTVGAKPHRKPIPDFTSMFGITDSTSQQANYLNQQLDGYLRKYFPHINACLKTVPEDWLCQVISGVRPYGGHDTAFELVWQRHRDRINRASSGKQEELLSLFSGRGFSLPPGAMVAATLELNRTTLDELNDANREILLKDADLKKEVLLFAEEKAIQYKLGLMQTMVGFCQVWMRFPDADLERAKAKSAAMAAYYDAVSSYYNVDVAFEELKLKADQLRVNTDLESDRNRVAAGSQNDGRAGGLGAVASAFGTTAANAAAAAGTLVAQIETGG